MGFKMFGRLLDCRNSIIACSICIVVAMLFSLGVLFESAPLAKAADEGTIVYVDGVSGDAHNYGSYIRVIKLEYFNTLQPNSKWFAGVLRTLLINTLTSNPSNHSSCQQVWHFSASEFDDVQEWCMNREKGTTTNKDFLIEFKDNRIK